MTMQKQKKRKKTIEKWIHLYKDMTKQQHKNNITKTYNQEHEDPHTLKNSMGQQRANREQSW